MTQPYSACMYRGCPLWSVHGIGRPTGAGGGTHQKVGLMSQPRGITDTASHMLACTRAKLRFLANFTLGS